MVERLMQRKPSHIKTVQDTTELFLVQQQCLSGGNANAADQLLLLEYYDVALDDSLDSLVAAKHYSDRIQEGGKKMAQ